MVICRLLALAAGLLSAVLTPCLLQLIVIYLATLAGLSAGELARPGALPAQAARNMLWVALAFVGGFSALFTMAGAVIGYAGKELQLFLADASRSVGIGAGLLLVAMGVWMGVKTRSLLVCRLPFAPAIAKVDRKDVFGSALMAAGFSLGCMTCFSGAIVATLLVYVGALGSAAVGAAVLLMFSLGVAIPFLAAAFYLSRVMPTMTYLARHAPLLGLASMTVIIAFGLVLITDNFHVLSNAIYPFLGLS
jgi:cytochrome c-type biogenesis protein